MKQLIMLALLIFSSNNLLSSSSSTASGDASADDSPFEYLIPRIGKNVLVDIGLNKDKSEMGKIVMVLPSESKDEKTTGKYVVKYTDGMVGICSFSEVLSILKGSAPGLDEIKPLSEDESKELLESNKFLSKFSMKCLSRCGDFTKFNIADLHGLIDKINKNSFVHGDCNMNKK